MSKKFLFSTLFVFSFVIPAIAGAITTDEKIPPALKRKNICTEVKPLTSGLLKNTWPGHIYPPDPRSYGFAYICGSRDCPRRWPARVYFSDGTLAFRLGYYGIWSGNGKPRSYTGTYGAPKVYVKNIVTKSKRKGKDGIKRNGKVYIAIGNKKCRSAIPGKRNGSTK